MSPLLQPRPAYLWESASWFAPLGIQGVLFPWLVVVVLQGNGAELGLVQASVLLPLVFLLPLAGTIAEHSDRRWILVGCHLGAALPPLLLALAIGMGWLHYWFLVACGLTYGIMTALAMPARDAMLYEVSGPRVRLQATVAATTSVQFGVQAVGFLLAGQADWLGAEIILLFQTVVLLLGGLVAWLYLPTNHRIARSQLVATRDILRRLPHTPIPAAMLINFMVGFFYISVHSVVIPLLIRDRFDGGAGAISLAFIVFLVGTVASNLLIMNLFRMVRLGRSAICAPVFGLAVMVLLVVVPNFTLLLLLMLVWGMGAGITIASGRTLVQEYAFPEARARIMALYQMTFLGAAPIGSILIGLSMDWFGLNPTIALCLLGPILMLVGLLLFSNLWQVTTPSAEGAHSGRVG